MSNQQAKAFGVLMFLGLNSWIGPQTTEAMTPILGLNASLGAYGLFLVVIALTFAFLAKLGI